MRIAELMIILSFSTLQVVFPWWVWLLAVLDILIRVVDDHKEWLKEKQADILNDIKILEEHRGKLIAECVEMEKKLGK
jgi:hypothetical protein